MISLSHWGMFDPDVWTVPADAPTPTVYLWDGCSGHSLNGEKECSCKRGHYPDMDHET